MYKKIFSTFLAVSFLVTSMPSYSAPFGRSKSSSSKSTSSKSKPSKSYSSPSKQSSSGSLSGGKSIGMSRSSVAQSVRDGSYKNTKPSNNNVNNNVNNNYNNRASNTNSYNNGYNNNYNNRNFNTGNYNRGNYNNRYNNGYNNGYNGARRYGTGALIGAAVAGALIGYILFQDNNGNSYFTHPSNPNMAYDANANVLPSVPVGNYNKVGSVNSNGVVEGFAGSSTMNGANNSLNSGFSPGYNGASNSSGSSVLSMLFWLLVIGGVLTGLYFLMKNRRKNKMATNSGVDNSNSVVDNNIDNNNAVRPFDFSNASNNDNMFNNAQSDNFKADMTNVKTLKEKILDDKDKFFMEFQKNNKPSKIDFIMSKTDPLMQDAISENVLSSDEYRTISVMQLESELVNITKEGTTDIATVLYRGIVKENDDETQINEMWHFKYIDNEWKLAGIEQV